MPRSLPSSPRSRLLLGALLALLAAELSPAPAAREPISVIYDGEYGGYVPVVRGIERPDLAAASPGGQLPSSPRIAKRRAWWGLARERRAGRTGTALPAPPGTADPSRRWERRVGITTQFWVLDGEGLPVAGARIYRYTDPAFYAVNDDDTGARLFAHYRYLPYPYAKERALADVLAHDETFQDYGFAPVAAVGPDIDERANPFVRDRVEPAAPPLEYVGSTDATGALRAVSGIFNLLDPEKFPRAVAPSAIRVGYIVVAEGYLPQAVERRHEKGGVLEGRTLILEATVDRTVLRSPEFAAALATVDRVDFADGARAAQDSDAAVDRAMAQLVPLFERLAPEGRAEAASATQARLVARLYRRAPVAAREPLAARAAALEPAAPARLYRLAAAQAGSVREEALTTARRVAGARARAGGGPAAAHAAGAGGSAVRPSRPRPFRFAAAGAEEGRRGLRPPALHLCLRARPRRRPRVGQAAGRLLLADGPAGEGRRLPLDADGARPRGPGRAGDPVNPKARNATKAEVTFEERAGRAVVVK
nr:hypothetical protein [Acidobacteriota bacterium]